MKKTLLLITALLLFVAACSGATTQLEETTTEPEVVPEEEQAAAPQEEEGARVPDHTFSLTGDNFNFYDEEGNVAPTLTVQQGDLVRIEYESAQGSHDWVLDAFNAATTVVRPGEGLAVVEFVADKTGEFEYFCSVGSHRANGMVGLLVVE